MKKLLALIFLLSLFTGCSKKSETVLIFNSEPAEKFIEVIDYIEEESMQKLISKKFSEELVISNFLKNKTDYNLNTKINYLLELPAYEKLSDPVVLFTDSSQIDGKNAYRHAFYNLPYKRNRMTGSMAELWIDYWEKNHNLKATKFLKELNDKSETIKSEAIRLSNKYYPLNINKRDTIETIFCIDGYRSSFTSDNTIFMELLTFSDFNIDRFTKILSHELHHVNYSNWLKNKFKLSSDKKKALFKIQSGIIKEGIAQQINYVDYNEQVIKLYNNHELLNELNTQFIYNLNRISNSSTPLTTYKETNTEMWENSHDLLKKYCLVEIDNATFSHRPTYKYYIGYHIYNAIEKNSKNGEFEFVLEHPESLLETYNDLRSDNDLLPEYSNEVVAIWENNFK